MKRMLEYLVVWWKTVLITVKVNQIISQQERTMNLMSDVVTLASGVSAKLDQLLAVAPVATQDQVDAVAKTLTDMGGKLDAVLTPPAAPAA